MDIGILDPNPGMFGKLNAKALTKKWFGLVEHNDWGKN